MTLDELESQLPWGLHDAYLERLELDWPNGQLIFDARVMISDRQDQDQRVRITITGLVYCVIEPPMIDATKGYTATPAGGLWIQPDPITTPPPSHPPTPAGCFLHRIFVSDWNSFIYICGRDAQLRWLEAEPSAARSEAR